MTAKNLWSKFGLVMSPDSWHNFRYDFIAAVLFSVFNVVFNQFYLPFAIRDGASNFQIGLLAAAPAIGLLFSPLWASWIERTDSPKPFVVWPNAAARLLIILPAFFGAPWVYVAVALVFHMLMGIQAPAYAPLMTRIYPPRLRGRLMGYVRVAMGLLMIPLAYAVGYWADASGPSGPLLLASAIGVLSVLTLLPLRDIAPATAPKQPAPAKRGRLKEQWSLVRNNRPLAVFLIATTFSGFGNILAGPLYQIIQVDRLELTNAEIGFTRVAYFACLLISFFVVGWAIDRYSPERTLTYGIAAFAVPPMLYGFFGNYASVIVASGIQGIGDAIWDIGILSYVIRLAPGREAAVFGLHLMLFGIRGTIGPLLSTGLADNVPLSVLLLGASACGWIGTLIFIVGSRHKANLKQQTNTHNALDS
ncbi:MFS transporter [Paenibacillus thermotolerans]|uniref:MFS transporter n=1 Tax=Paenibacillus thermotolerans TaxID=3027807 RepID=UPI0023688D2D|nr:MULTISPECIES: MFS transporter [unclassified Paenibacillus]